MQHFLGDLWNMISSLSFIDYVLYFAVITLIMLIVSLIFVMLEEKDNDKDNKDTILDKKETKEEPLQEEKEEDLDLVQIMENINEAPKPLSDMTLYEEEQEQKAIISYDELIKGTNQKVINYDKEEMVDDLIPVKKISVQTENMKPLEITPQKPEIEVSPLSNSKLFSYEKEEAFLKALKELNELLNE